MIFKKEKEVIELMFKHLDKVDDCLTTAMKAVETYLKGEIPEANSLALKISGIKAVADDIKSDIWGKFYQGAYFPVLRQDIYNMVRSVDRMADAAGACCDFFLEQRPEIPEDLKSQFTQVIRESFSVISSLKEGVLSYLKGNGEIDTIREKAKQVRTKQLDVHKIESDLTRQIFAGSLEPWYKMHLKPCLSAIVEISGQAREAADELELITMKSRV